jgi:nicotinate-nucleotide--dimethylbenzimidazole phosphoribosyltransferase
MSLLKLAKITPIAALPRLLDKAIATHLEQQTKPPGSLGVLELVATQIARVQQTLSPEVDPIWHGVFAASHGITQAGVSPYPSSVTAQMVANFLNGGAAINVMCREYGVALSLIDAGVDGELPHDPNLLRYPAGAGTEPFHEGPAMTQEQLVFCLQKGAEVVRNQATEARVISLGEMGIGNTTSSAAILCALLKLTPDALAGAGTGAPPEMQQHKSQIISQALALHQPKTPTDCLRCLGGFEIAMMVGAYLQAAAQGKLVVVDGFIATAAWALAAADQPTLRDYSVFSHLSSERGHAEVLKALKVVPLLQLNLRLGEGTGALAAMPLIRVAASLMREMATFSSAGVSKRVN